MDHVLAVGSQRVTHNQRSAITERENCRNHPLTSIQVGLSLALLMTPFHLKLTAFISLYFSISFSH